MRTTSILLAGAALMCISTTAKARTYYEETTYYNHPQSNVSRHYKSGETYRGAQPVYQRQPQYQQAPRYQQPAYYPPANPSPWSVYVTARGNYTAMQNDTEGDYTYDLGAYEIIQKNFGHIDDKVFGASAAVGIKNGMFRAEVEGLWNMTAEDQLYGSSSSENKVEVSQQSVLLNMYLDFETNTNATPYFGVGVGYTKLDVDYYAGSKSKGSLAWQVGGGINLAATEHVSFDLGYRYMYNGKLSVEDATYVNGVPEFRSIDMESYSHNFYAGIRYTF